MSRKKGPEGFFLATAAAAVAFHWALSLLLPGTAPDEKQYLGAVFPESYGYTEKSGTPPRYTPFTLDQSGKPSPLGIVFRTTEVTDVPRGYAGPVPVLVGIDKGGLITGVQILEHNETPSYVFNVESRSFLDQFTGLAVTAPLQLDVDIDGVSRATVTAAAVTNGIRIASREAATRILGLVVPAESPGRMPWAELAAMAGLFALALVSMRGPLRPLRWLSYAAAIAVLGYWTGTYLSTETAAKILLWRMPSLAERPHWYLLAAFAAVMAVAWRNVYCARLCPFGAMQEFLGLVSPGGLRGTEREERSARILRPLFLWLTAMAVFLFGRADAASYEPFKTAFDFKGQGLHWIFLATVLALALFRHRFWCRWFCPTGLCLQMLGRMRTKTPFQDS